jgi:NAD(P)H-hydrate epimerase
VQPALLLTRDQVRALDRRATTEFGVPDVVLMENAGRGAAELLQSWGVHGRVAVCCGKGNNGGDGLVIARHLDNHAIAVHVHLFSPPEKLTGAAAVNYRIIAKSGLPVTTHPGQQVDIPSLARDLNSSAWVVDALFGTGLAGAVRAPLDGVIAAINACGARVLAVDIPSGLDCDTGSPLGPAVRATHTATFVALKKGFQEGSAREWLGEVHVVEIGLPRVLLEAAT